MAAKALKPEAKRENRLRKMVSAKNPPIGPAAIMNVPARASTEPVASSLKPGKPGASTDISCAKKTGHAAQIPLQRPPATITICMARRRGADAVGRPMRGATWWVDKSSGAAHGAAGDDALAGDGRGMTKHVTR